jgi:hypothetical protein
MRTRSDRKVQKKQEGQPCQEWRAFKPHVMEFNSEGERDEKRTQYQEDLEGESFHLGPMLKKGESFLILNSFSGRNIMK